MYQEKLLVGLYFIRVIDTFGLHHCVPIIDTIEKYECLILSPNKNVILENTKGTFSSHSLARTLLYWNEPN